MSEFTPGRLVGVFPGVQRLVAPNASALTGPGTNTYLLGDPPVAVLDPGPDHPGHLEAIRAAAPGLERIFVTHTHLDHSPGAQPLAAATGAELVGLPAPVQSPHDDRSFSPHVRPRRDQRFTCGAGTLQAIDTPGHASNHVCYLHVEQGLLFTGDHVLDGVTPVIPAPDGDMAAYLESLERLKAYPLRALAPGHGRLLTDPFALIEHVIAHRLKREAKVLAAVERAGSGSLETLLPLVYDDVSPALHGIARLSLEAHLVKLAAEGRCVRAGDVWSACRA